MALNRFKLALNAAEFPMVSLWQPRAVMVPGLDAAPKTSRQFFGAEENADYNTPELLYCENVVPVTGGIKSVRYLQSVSPTANSDFDQCFPLRDAEENTVLFSPAGGKNYVLDNGTNLWTSYPLDPVWDAVDPNYILSPDSIDTPASSQISRAYVNGMSFIAYSKLSVNLSPATTEVDASLYFWDPASATKLVWATQGAGAKILNVPAAFQNKISGIAGASGYLILYSGLTFLWAPYNGTAFDFQPTLNGEATGAGSQIPEDIKGPITAVIPMAGGAIIFTTKNAVAAVYSSRDFTAPWIFKEISNAGGVESSEQVSIEATGSSIYAYTSGGLQQISLNSAQPVLAAASDFLSSRIIEYYSTDSRTLTQSELPINLFTKLTYLGSRFLVISYGTYPGVFSYALLYDSALQRWGKFKVNHVDCFSYNYGKEVVELTYDMFIDLSYDDMGADTYEDLEAAGGGITYPRQTIAFLQRTGAIQLAISDDRINADLLTGSTPVAIVGRLQLVRQKFSELHEVELEGTKSVSTFIVPSLDGRTLQAPEQWIVVEQSEDYMRLGGITAAKNFNILLEGDFHLTSVVVAAQNIGDF